MHVFKSVWITTAVFIEFNLNTMALKYPAVCSAPDQNFQCQQKLCFGHGSNVTRHLTLVLGLIPLPLCLCKPVQSP